MNLASLSGRRRWVLITTGVAVVALVIAVRAWQGRSAQAATAAATPTVAVARVAREELIKAIDIAAEFRPYAEVDLHAKVSGYVRQMKVDIGDHVQAGQLLAVLEVPELRDDLDHAAASLRRAQADYRDAHLAYSRLVAVNREHPNLIAQQDLDTAEAHEATAEGSLGAARADVEKYRTLAGYARIVAPFAGVITKRYAEPGSLIQAGTASNTQAMPLVRVSDNSVLRLDFPVSVDYVHGVRPGAPVSIRVDSLGGRVIQARIARIADQVDDSHAHHGDRARGAQPGRRTGPGHVRHRHPAHRRAAARAGHSGRGGRRRRQERVRGERGTPPRGAPGAPGAGDPGALRGARRPCRRGPRHDRQSGSAGRRSKGRAAPHRAARARMNARAADR